MCRHLGYLGPATSITTLLNDGPRSLMKQSWAPADMRGGGTINADGFGVVWWPDEGQLGRYRSASPVWADPFVAEGLSVINSRAVMIALRSATVGMPVERSAAAPFTDGRWAFSLNGLVRDWPGSLVSLAAQLPVAELLQLESPTDAATLWLLLRSRLRAAEPEVALLSLVHDVIALAPDSRLNMLLCDGGGIWATAWYHSLWTLVDENVAVVSSEPYDDDERWQQVPDRHLVCAMPGKLIVTPLEVPAS
ncbi:ergothioneine biosynthesis protein EgtC [Rhodococcus chondri]|uniref:Gamma-glutamyl-hercynylcysteine sulfoxide hydrolase n=1 Tax=Rhodococcus chondri TaxID=3065941 RepID=A0ABU7JNL4_9NOCA|nr:ergothioneine biosynthesis protein EgtC [Rhodococcus sp. CC-R104]MEE2031620.1 ergothioneine biosynthesis protein EgtC [Rhodococcus sp. CC-R104]